MKSILAIWASLVLAAGTAAAAAGPVPVAGTKEAKPGFLPAAPLRTTFDCAGRDTLILAPGLVDTLRDDTTGGPSLLDAYACVPWAETGPEHIYRLEVTQELDFWAGLRDLAPDLDLDLFLLDGCDTDACLIGQNTELGARLVPGTYWLIVDGAAGPGVVTAGAYTLALEARYPGLLPEICDGSLAEPMVCTVGGGIEAGGTLFGQPDLLRSHPCNPFLARGGEVWYAVTLLPGQALSVNMPTVAAGLDAVLWLFGSCGPEAACLAVADEELTGVSESLFWQNPEAQTVTVWLGVDAARAPADAEAGAFTLAITCGSEVPAERTPFGSARALFR
ncbi:MAG: hypothetical protein ABR506_10045 [Candidatus Krumholzibacteriia bacterium]